jgi:hypothetical protein
MNYKIWSKKKFWIILIIIFFSGMIIAPKNPTKEVFVNKEVPTQCNYSKWQQLKEIDDTVFIYCAINSTLASKGMIAVYNQDIKEMESITSQVKEVNNKINAAGDIRRPLLRELGYEVVEPE